MARVEPDSPVSWQEQVEMPNCATQGSQPGPSAEETLDAGQHDRFAARYARMGCAGIVEELRFWTAETSAGQAVAAMARLIALSLASDNVSDDERRKAAELAVVVEQIVRAKLKGSNAALATVETAHRLLLLFGETYSPNRETIVWMRRERERRGLPAID
jgi:hypothetical protein